MDISEKISGFRNMSGSNYRVERNNPQEERTYNIMNQLNLDGDNNGEITLPEYLKYLQLACRELKIKKRDLNTAKNIDDLLNNPALLMRLIAAEELGKSGDAIAAPALTDALMNRRETIDVRSACARALNRIAGKEAAEKAMTAILFDFKETPETRAIAAGFLGGVGSRSSVTALVNTIKRSADFKVCSAAAAALEKAKGAFPKGKEEQMNKMIEEALNYYNESRNARIDDSDLDEDL